MTATIEQVLASLGLERFAETFKNNDIDIDMLRSLSDDDLRELGIESMGARKKIVAAVAALAGTAPPPPPANPTPGVPMSAGLQAITAGTIAFDAPKPLPAAGPPMSRGLQAIADGGSFIASEPIVAAPSLRVGTAPPIGVGQKVRDRYLLLNELGAGAMGAVYRGFDELTRKDVAVKTLLPEHASNQALVAQMVKEVALAQEVTHAKLLRIHTVEPGPPPFIVMEFIDGETLHERVQASGGKLPVAEVQRILGDVLEGLEVLHAARIVHRDVKPANVLISKTGAVKLSDYGVASTTRDQLRGAPQAGTLLYMAPEQLRGERADARSDLYAVGMMAFELLVGRFPYATTSADAVKAWHLSPSRDLTALRDSILFDVVTRALEPDATARWPSAAAMRTALEDAERLARERAEETRKAEEGRKAEEIRKAEEASARAEARKRAEEASLPPARIGDGQLATVLLPLDTGYQWFAAASAADFICRRFPDVADDVHQFDYLVRVLLALSNYGPTWFQNEKGDQTSIGHFKDWLGIFSTSVLDLLSVRCSGFLLRGLDGDVEAQAVGEIYLEVLRFQIPEALREAGYDAVPVFPLQGNRPSSDSMTVVATGQRRSHAGQVIEVRQYGLIQGDNVIRRAQVTTG